MTKHSPTIRVSTTSNGIRVITEYLPHVKIVSFGIGSGYGTRDEPENLLGITHLVEHMVFRGHPTLDTASLWTAFESQGACVNACTAAEYVKFYGTCLDETFLGVFDLFCRLIATPQWSEEDLDAEKQIVLREMLKKKSRPPQALLHKRMRSALYGKNTINREGLGEPTTLEHICLTSLRDHHRTICAGNQLIVSAVGNVDHRQVRDIVEKRFAPLPKESCKPDRMDPKLSHDGFVFQKAPKGKISVCRVSIAPISSKHILPAQMAVHILGGSSTSRLFKELRHYRQQLYSISAQILSYSDFSEFVVQFDCNPTELHAVLFDGAEEIVSEWGYGSITETELTLGKIRMRTSMAAASERTEYHRACLHHSLRVFGRIISIEEKMAAIERLTLYEVNEAARILGSLAHITGILGSVPKDDQELLAQPISA